MTLDKFLDELEEYLKGSVSVHSQFAAYAKGDFGAKKEKIRAAEAARLLAHIQKKRKALEKDSGTETSVDSAHQRDSQAPER